MTLTPDDLVVLSNRGIVKRAQQELQSGQLTFEIEDNAGSLTVRWSDGIECALPSGVVVGEGRCSCDATSVCRHLVRSVLAYQSQAENKNQEASQTVTASQSNQIWNPADITDEELEKHFRKATLSKIRNQFDEGHVVELVKSAKPSVYFHTLSCGLRFLVQNDVRYTHCDCNEPVPCSHVPLAVWAFRLLDQGKSSGLFSTKRTKHFVPSDLLDEIERLIDELVIAGFAHSPRTMIDKFRRAETKRREEGLVWVAEIISELVQLHESYANHDARFSASRVVELIGELCIRSDAIRNDTEAVPQLFIRGSKSDVVTDIGSARLVGLGCGAKALRREVEIAAYLQDIDSGSVYAVIKTFAESDDVTKETRKDFYQLAQAPALKGFSFASIGKSQLLIKGGKRAPNNQFLPSRAQATANPQGFNWESLRRPLFVDDYAELQTRLQTLPPAALRPRRVTDDFHVFSVSRIEGVKFLTIEQALQAVLFDAAGNAALLVHPFFARARHGFEVLYTMLVSRPNDLRFVAGKTRFSARGLEIAPVSLVFEGAEGRMMIQPWVEKEETKEISKELPEARSASRASVETEPLSEFLLQISDALGELVLIGLERANKQTEQALQELAERGASLGFARFLTPLQKLEAELNLKSSVTHWEAKSSAQCVKKLASWLLLAVE